MEFNDIYIPPGFVLSYIHLVVALESWEMSLD